MTQDAKFYFRKYETADLFITFKCNPTWPEIKRELKKGQTPSQRRFFSAKNGFILYRINSFPPIETNLSSISINDKLKMCSL